jgi:hypothetical protein
MWRGEYYSSARKGGFNISPSIGPFLHDGFAVDDDDGGDGGGTKKRSPG